MGVLNVQRCKKINDLKGDEYQASIFHYLLYLYYQINAPEQLQYLCNLYEIGKIKDSYLIYGIMEHCGDELLKINKYLLMDNKIPTKESKLLFIITIFKKCLLSLKLIHDIGYLHLDIKLENYLIKFSNNKIQIKIIDFGFVTKCNSVIEDLIGTGMYIPNDYLKNFFDGKKTNVEKHHDIFSLGCVFIEILYKIFHLYDTSKKEIYLACPITFENPNKTYTKDKPIKNPRYKQYPSRENIFMLKENYNQKTHNEDMQKIINLMNKIFKNVKNIEIITGLIYIIIFRMVNPDTLIRYKSINEILPIINSLLLLF